MQRRKAVVVACEPTDKLIQQLAAIIIEEAILTMPGPLFRIYALRIPGGGANPEAIQTIQKLKDVQVIILVTHELCGAHTQGPFTALTKNTISLIKLDYGIVCYVHIDERIGVIDNGVHIQRTDAPFPLFLHYHIWYR